MLVLDTDLVYGVFYFYFFWMFFFARLAFGRPLDRRIIGIVWMFVVNLLFFN